MRFLHRASVTVERVTDLLDLQVCPRFIGVFRSMLAVASPPLLGLLGAHGAELRQRLLAPVSTLLPWLSYSQL